MNKNLLLIFIKNPVLGKVKTRLGATLGAENALATYKILLNHTRQITTPLSSDKALFYSDYIDNEDEWDPVVFFKFLQQGNDLGERMQKAFAEGFNRGYTKICIIGSDCYELTSKIIEEAFNQLTPKDVVIGPTVDGGYYLLGMKKPEPVFFENKQWSTNTVFTDTLENAKKLNLTIGLLPVLTDVDEEKDLFTMKDSDKIKT